jgi:CubicO group peptidase (beta-lactamase class C family)
MWLMATYIIQVAPRVTRSSIISTMLPRGSLESAGISAGAVLNFVNNINQNGAHSYILARHGQVVSQGYWTPFKPQLYHSLLSVTKSFTSTAIGFAVQEGLVKLDDFVIEYFQDKLSNPPCENMRKMRVEHLLKMSTGHGGDYSMLWNHSPINEKDVTKDADDVYHFLTTYVPDEPGSIFRYNSGATFMLGAILQKVSGLNVVEYLKPRLFEPLNIDVRADVNKQGQNHCAGGFQIKPEDLVKFGLFYINKGKWNGRQLLSPEWIEEATSKQADTAVAGSVAAFDKNWAAGYGYQFWMSADGHSFRADGMYGQFVIMSPKSGSVLVMLSGSADVRKLMRDGLDLIASVDSGEENNSDTDSNAELEEKLRNLQLALPEGEELDSRPIPSYKYKLSENELGFTAIQIESQILKIWLDKDSEPPFLTAPVGQSWTTTVNGENPFGYNLLIGELALSGAWSNDNLVIDIIIAETVGGYRFELSFKSHYLEIFISKLPDFSSKFKILGIDEKQY